MQKLITILVGCSLTLAVSLQAAKPEGPNKKAAQSSKPKSAPKQQVVRQQHAAPKSPIQAAPKTQRSSDTVRRNDLKIGNRSQLVTGKKQERTVPAVQSEKQTTVQPKKLKPAKEPKLDKSTAPSTTTTSVPADSLKKNAKTTTKPSKVDPATVRKIQAQHTDFKAKPNTAIASAQFNPNYRIEAAQNWSGAQYNAFRTYQPQWHDQGWYRSRYTTLSLIGGGWYFWDGGYWYPAWGYDDAAAYYPYDGPIYVGSNPRPFDQVVADVQAVLQEMGYYRGEVDGLVGPLTRQALAEYQQAAGLYATQAIDQPTLESLGLG